jgi:hypothetical protein
MSGQNWNGPNNMGYKHGKGFCAATKSLWAEQELAVRYLEYIHVHKEHKSS